MSAVYPILLLPVALAAVAAAALGAAVLFALRTLRRQVAALRAEISSAVSPEGAQAEIRKAVADALTAERERELAEARAFWAEQEAREESGQDRIHLPRQTETGLAADDDDRWFEEALCEAIDELVHEEARNDTAAEEATAVDRRRHPSHPDFRPSPAVPDHERTADRLASLADSAVPLTDVRPGPLGTLDLYVFADGSTLCVTPGSHPATERLIDALRAGEPAALMGGSAVGGAHALTFGIGDGGEETVYVLADRVVASL